MRLITTKLLHNMHYFVSLSLFLLGFYTLLSNSNLIKKMIGLNIMDTSIFLFLVSVGYIKGGRAPIINLNVKEAIYVNPVPQALVLTGIVVSFSISVFAFTLIKKLYSHYNTIDTEEIMEIRSSKK